MRNGALIHMLNPFPLMMTNSLPWNIAIVLIPPNDRNLSEVLLIWVGVLVLGEGIILILIPLVNSQIR